MENKFEQLLRGTLSEEASQKLLKEIELDPILKKEFEEYRDAWELVKTLERRKLKEKVSKIAENELISQRKSKRWIWYSAASVMVLALCYWAFQPSISGEQMAQTYFEPYPDKFTTMGQSIDPLIEVMTAYNQRDYDKAEELFSQLPKEVLNDVEIYKGISLYQIGDKKSAKGIFKKLSQDSTNAFNEPSLWYLSLAHLALNEKDSAIIVLNKIKTDSLITFHKEDAIKILEQLK